MLSFTILPLISGIALWFAFPDHSLFFLSWVGLMPFLYFLTQERPWKTIVAGNFVLGLTYFGGVLYWIPEVLIGYGGLGWGISIPIFFLMMLLLSLFLLPFSVLTHAVSTRSRAAALWSAPGFWVLSELLRNYYAVGGFPWALLGHSQYPFEWMRQLADISGVYLISFLIVLGNCALLALFRFRSYQTWVLPAIFALLFVGSNLYGWYRVEVWQVPAGKSIKAALVQPNISLSAPLEHYAKKYFEVLPAYYRQAVSAGAAWVVFPEAPNPYFFDTDFYFRTFWQRLVRNSGVPVLLNSTSVETKSSTRYYNGALLIGPEERPAYRYHKMHLVPFGEYVPAADWLSFVQPLVQEVAGFSAGTTAVVGDVGGIPFGTLICFEGIFPESAREFVRQGAQLLVNITNDAWYGRSAAPRQHLEFGAFRAVENRKPILRCANSGYSAVIDPLGRIQQELGLFQDGIVLADVTACPYRSIYSRVGEWLNISLVVLALVTGVAVFRPRSKSRRK